MAGERDWLTPEAAGIPFDNDGTGFSSDNVHDALLEVGASASSGFTYGRSGSFTGWQWMRVPGNVVSNRGAPTIFLQTAILDKIAFSMEGASNLGKARIRVYSHDGDSINLTSLISVVVPSPTRSHIFDVSANNIVVPYGKQIAVRVRSVNGIQLKNVVVSLNFKGTN